MSEPASRLLPALRQELELFPGAPNHLGAQQWIIYDPLRHQYLTVDRDAAALLSIWQEMPEGEFVSEASARLGRTVTRDETSEVVYFLHANSLTEVASGDGAKSLAEQASASRRGLLTQLMHSYLFIRIPLFRPHRFLQWTMPLALPFLVRGTWIAIAHFGALGVYLVSRQWDTFIATFLNFLSVDGLMAYGLALVLIKILHELGHAYVATHHGVRVTSMGIAFMVMMPLLYTDVTGAWRLRSRRMRLQINGAGIVVELGLACIATCLWVFLPDGPMRSVAFVAATSSWIISLAVNLNPFMKFDGYYLLADGLGIPNLQGRSFTLARWRLREWLFDLGEPQPDSFQPGTVRALVIYAWATWLYRLMLFIGIALLVYHLFFKILGVILFVTEIAWFIALPISRELRAWWEMRSEIMSRKRTFVTMGAICCCAALVVIPIRWPVTLPGVIESSHELALHAPRSSQITSWHMYEGRPVVAGDVLATLQSPVLENNLAQLSLAIALLDLRLSRVAGDRTDLAHRSTLMQERRARLEELAGYQRQIDSLVIRAPFPGELRDVDQELHPAAWVGETRRLARMIRGRNSNVRAYANEGILWRLTEGSAGVFIPDDPQLDAVEVRLDEISVAGVDELDISYLASVHGGPIPSERDSEEAIRPHKNQHVLRMSAIGDALTLNRVVRGVVHLPGKPESLGQTIWRHIARVVVREAGL